MLHNTDKQTYSTFNRKNVRPDYVLLYDYLIGLAPGLSLADWRIVEAVFEVHRYKQNELILNPGEVCKHVWFINHGIIEKYKVVQGREHVSDLIPKAGIFSDFSSFLFQVPSKTGIRALEKTETLRIKHADVQRLYADMAEADRIGRLIAEKILVAQSQRIDQLTLMSPVERYQAFLAANSEIALRVPQYLIASYLSMTPESLSRIRARIRKIR